MLSINKGSGFLLAREMRDRGIMFIAVAVRRIAVSALLTLPLLATVPASRGPRPEEGWATFYTRRRAGHRTASGQRYDPRALVAAHPTLPFGTQVRVTSLETGKSIVVRVIDRGPAKAERRRGYIIDLSRAAAESLAFVRQGRARVRLDVVANASGGGL